MSIIYNGVEINRVFYNGQEVSNINYNGQDIPLAGGGFTNKWSGGIYNLPLIYQNINDDYTNYVDIIPDTTKNNLIISPVNEDTPCFLGGGLYYDEDSQAFLSLEEIDSSYPSYKIFGGSLTKAFQNLLFIAISNNPTDLKFNLCYMKNTKSDCGWDLNYYSWATDYNDEFLHFDPDTHLFSGQTISHTWGSYDYTWEAISDGTGFTVRLDNTSYGTVYLT